ncbi:hypothetical protein CHGG_08457 [Chaetomium globosum CBS 148.51]|uniref:Methyltransferase domain-containing protein n=1 Tax=Chaetomium globosum (strain ATCC 6205 / CBS 148.51 / DSM 1962 / NBRC 6347 / NRRL 1970) TaxID=306901 RepID=Q2GU97_CHAGB|nr:uncharacterized protein CHGG_08457 [Chaetomium globosum CBS 148.51]EAQ84443.1 hypothetical protein CHGG_08457 [Chaetomium globosum CBS 148.51]
MSIPPPPQPAPASAPDPEQPYAPGHAASQTQHHEWRTASNSAAHLLSHLRRLAPTQHHPLHLLDVGAGSGTISASLVQHLAPLGGSVVATDISDEILARAADHAADRRRGLRKFHKLMVATLVANGGEDRGGRKLLSWVLEAGVDSEDVEAGFGAWCFSTAEDKRVWGESMISRLQTGQMRDKGLEMGITTVQDIEDMIKAWREWIRTEGATLGLMNGEVIVKKK